MCAYVQYAILFVFICVWVASFSSFKNEFLLRTSVKNKNTGQRCKCTFQIKKGVILSSHVTGVIYQFIFLMLHDNNVIYFSSSHHH